MHTPRSDIPLSTRFMWGLTVGLLLTAAPGCADEAAPTPVGSEQAALASTSLDRSPPTRQGLECTEFFGMKHCPLGTSELTLSEEGLVVTSGDEQGAGVRIETEGAGSWDAWLAPMDPQVDRRMVLSFRGALPDGSTELREQVAVTRSPVSGEGAIYVKPSIHGAATYTVRGYREGDQVFELSHVAPVREEIGGPRGPGDDQWQRLIYFPGPWRSAHGIWGDDGCTPGLDFPWPIPIRFPKGDLSTPVDVVTFEPEGVLYQSKTLHEVSFEGVGMESFVIEQEARSP